MMFSRYLAVQALQATLAAAFVPQRASLSFLHHNHQHHQSSDHPHHGHMELHSSANKNDLDDSFGYFDDEFNRITGTGINDRHEEEDQEERISYKYGILFDVDDDLKPEDVHIILFNPDTDREGVHTIEFPKESGNNMILAFESRLECEVFSASLKEQQFFDPSPQEMNLEALENYCAQIGVEVQVVPEGMNLTPPKESVLNLGINPDLEKEMKMLDYLFHISASSNDNSNQSSDGSDFDDGDMLGAWE